jgi:hypothetical protein
MGSATDNVGFSDLGAVVATTPTGSEAIVWAGADGLPRRALFGGVIFSFSNWRATHVDIAMVAPTGETRVVRDVPVDAVASAYLRRTRLPASGSVAALTLGLRDWLKVGSTLLNVASCAGAVAAAGGTFGAAAVLAGVVCGAAVYDIYATWTADDDPAMQASADAFALTLDVVKCAGIRTGSACAQAIASASLTVLEVALDLIADVQDELRSAEAALVGPVALYPLDGNGTDASGSGLHGIAQNVQSVPDRARVAPEGLPGKHRRRTDLQPAAHRPRDRGTRPIMTGAWR